MQRAAGAVAEKAQGAAQRFSSEVQKVMQTLQQQVEAKKQVRALRWPSRWLLKGVLRDSGGFSVSFRAFGEGFGSVSRLFA